jgi:hypothetical protein
MKMDIVEGKESDGRERGFKYYPSLPDSDLLQRHVPTMEGHAIDRSGTIKVRMK